MKTFLHIFALAAATAFAVQSAVPPQTPNTWFVRVDGGTRYSANNLTGQCDGLADVSYAAAALANGGSAKPNLHCAFNDVRWMWLDGTYGVSKWVMAGGDTLVIRGCASMATQQNPDAPHCRIGTDAGNMSGFWCAGVEDCGMPPPPSGTAAQPTRILGACAYGTYTCNPVTAYPYTNNNLTQLFGGFGLWNVVELNGASNIVLEGLEITTHNGQCSRVGAPSYPRGCNTYPPSADDYATTGITTNNQTSNITLQDVYIHGMNSSGIGGPIGGPFTLTNVSIDFNAFAAWNFDDGSSTPNGANASITQSYVSMVGNGCQEQYPIANAQFPAVACWDTNSAGFGDAWSGQNASLTSFSCDHCYVAFNTKDGAIGPHTLIHNLSLTNSEWIGNMGQDNKWGQDNNSTLLFQNNRVIGNCMRMVAALPGAAQSFAQSTGLGGSYLTGFCRAAGDFFAYTAGPNMTANFTNNTFVTYQPTVFDLGCNTANGCAGSAINLANNIFLGYTSGSTVAPLGGNAPGLYYFSDASVKVNAQNNIEFGVRNGDACGANGTLCSDPLLVNEPAQGSIPPESALDNFNFAPASASPAIGAGAMVATVPVSDALGNLQPTPPTIGAIAASSGSAGNGSTGGGTGSTPPPPPPAKIATSVTLSSTATNAYLSKVTGTVSGASAAKKAPTGTVTFSVQGTVVYTVSLPKSGNVSEQIPTLLMQFLPVTVQYGGDANYAGSQAVTAAKQ